MSTSNHRVYNSVNFKFGGNNNQKENSDNLNLFNSSENVNVNYDPNHSINFVKNKDNLSNSSKLEIKDLENYENDFKTSNNWNNKSYTMRHKEEINRKKSLLSLYSNSNVGNLDHQFSYSEKFNNDNYDNTYDLSNKDYKEDMSNCNYAISHNEENNKNEGNINNLNVMEKLNNLKMRTQGILEMYSKRFNNFTTLKSNN